MFTIDDLADKIGELFQNRSRAHFRGTMFVKLGLVIGGAALAGAAEIYELASAHGKFSAASILGFVAIGLIVLGGIFLALTERDTSEALESARQAVEYARTYDDEIAKFRGIQR